MIPWFSAMAFAQPTTVLMGNSLLGNNQLPLQLRDDLRTVPAWSDAETVPLILSGSGFPEHEVALSTPGPWADALLGDPPDDWVLGDRPNNPALPVGSDPYEDSYAALEDLVVTVGEGPRRTLYMSWGRRIDDTVDWTVTNDALDAGYVEFASRLRAAGHPVAIAPVGRAWRHLYEEAVAAGDDPLAPDSLFHQLYAPDLSHPSAWGSYLARCVLFRTLTGRDPDTGEPPPTGVDAATAEVLRDAARAVTADPFDPDPGFAWAHTWSTWTGAAGPDVHVGTAALRPVVRVDGAARAEGVTIGGLVDGLPTSGELWVEAGGALAVDALAVEAGGVFDLKGRLEVPVGGAPMVLEGVVGGTGVLGVDACPPGRTVLASVGPDADVAGWTPDAPCDAALVVEDDALVLVVDEEVHTGLADTGPAEASEDPDGTPTPQGCGCTSSGPVHLGWMALLLLVPGVRGAYSSQTVKTGADPENVPWSTTNGS